jgi:hypothetical protein
MQLLKNSLLSSKQLKKNKNLNDLKTKTIPDQFKEEENQKMFQIKGLI